MKVFRFKKFPRPRTFKLLSLPSPSLNMSFNCYDLIFHASCMIILSSCVKMPPDLRFSRSAFFLSHISDRDARDRNRARPGTPVATFRLRRESEFAMLAKGARTWQIVWRRDYSFGVLEMRKGRQKITPTVFRYRACRRIFEGHARGSILGHQAWKTST